MTEPVKLEFPTCIGLMGAPGSGKQAVIEAFQKIAGDWFEEKGSPLNVLPNAGQHIEDKYDVAMGSFGGWQHDLQAFFTRTELEDDARLNNKSFITSGTAIEHIAHCGTNMENVILGIQTPEQQALVEQYKIAMMSLTFLFSTQGFRYWFGFYLPHPDKVLIVPGEDQTENNYNKRVDNGIRQILGNFNLRIQVLDQPTAEEKAQEIFNVVKDIMENGPKLPEAQPTPELDGGDAPGEGIPEPETAELDSELEAVAAE